MRSASVWPLYPEIPDIESHGFQKEKATGDAFQVNRGQTQRWSSGMDLRDERPPGS